MQYSDNENAMLAFTDLWILIYNLDNRIKTSIKDIEILKYENANLLRYKELSIRVSFRSYLNEFKRGISITYFINNRYKVYLSVSQIDQLFYMFGNDDRLINISAQLHRVFNPVLQAIKQKQILKIS